MLGFLFGWKKAVKCKKLIKKIQCRLKLLKSKRIAIVRGLRDDIAQLIKNGHEQVAFKRLQQLYLDENILSVYEMLETFSEFITLNLSYIRKHKNIPNDIKEAISTLIFASARFGDMPELRQFRELFRERYGQKFVTTAVDLLPGNLVNCQVKENLTEQPIPQGVKNAMVEEIMRDYFCKPGQLTLKYKPETQLQLEMVTDQSDTDVQETSITRTGSSIELQSSLSTDENTKHKNIPNSAPMSPYKLKFDGVEENESYLSENSTEYSVDYLKDVQEFMSPIKRGTHWMDQDQRFFLFMMETPMEIIHDNEVYYDTSPYTQRNPEYNSNKISASPSHVHPKLPDYNDLVAKFRALKENYQQSISRS